MREMDSGGLEIPQLHQANRNLFGVDLKQGFSSSIVSNRRCPATIEILTRWLSHEARLPENA